MRYIRSAAARRHEAFPGVVGRVVHGATMTMVTWALEPGAEVPTHEHVHEQILHVVRGALQVTVASQSRRLGPGDSVVIPPRVPHSLRVLERAQVVDVFHPVRRDFV